MLRTYFNMRDPETASTMHQRMCELLPNLRRFARSLTGDPQDADDLVQTALERALARSAQWREEMSLEGWLFGIVRNAWVDEARARQRRWRVFVPMDDEPAAATVTEGRIAAMSVEAAMGRLPEEQRSAVALVLVAGLSYREAAATLGIPIGTLTSRLARGRKALQRMLGDDANESV